MKHQQKKGKLLPLCPYCGKSLVDVMQVDLNPIGDALPGFKAVACIDPYCREQPSYYIMIIGE